MKDKTIMSMIDVIIPTYNRPDLLKRCLSSFAIQTFPKDDFKVIVINDGSEQGIEAIAGEFKEKINILYLKKERRGPATARNEGLKYAEAPIIAFTDDHCVLDVNWLSEIYKGFRDYPGVACVKGKTLALEPNEFAKICEKYIYGSKRSHATNNIAYKKEVFDVIGDFDTRYREAAGEDVDFKWRFLKAGYKRIYLENMIAYHPHEDSVRVFKEKCYRVGNGLAVFVGKYILKRPFLAIGAFIYDIRYLPLSGYYLLFRKKSISPCSLKSIRSAFIFKGFMDFFIKRKK